MRLTDTLDALLRLLLTSEEDDTGGQAATGVRQRASEAGKPESPPASDPATPDTDASHRVSPGAGLPIQDSVEPWRPNDGPDPVVDEAAAPAPTPPSQGEGLHVAAAEPGENALPEWVRRVREHRIGEDPREPAAGGLDVQLIEQLPPEPPSYEPAAVPGEAPVELPPLVFPKPCSRLDAAPVEPPPLVFPEAVLETRDAAPARAAAAGVARSRARDSRCGSGRAAAAGASRSRARDTLTLSVAAPIAEDTQADAVQPGIEPDAGSADHETVTAEVSAAHEADSADAPDLPGSEVVSVPTGSELARLEAAAEVVESLNLGFHLGCAVERIATAADLGSAGAPALREAIWLIERYVTLLERRPIGADLHVSSARLARTGDAIADLKALAAALDAEASGRSSTGGADSSLEPSETSDSLHPDAPVTDVWPAPGDDDPERPGLGRIRRLSS